MSDYDDCYGESDCYDEFDNTGINQDNGNDSGFSYDPIHNRFYRDSKYETKITEDSPISKWTRMDIIEFICSLDPEYQQYESVLAKEFSKQQFDGTCIHLLEKEDLKSFGIENFKHRALIYERFQELLIKEKEEQKIQENSGKKNNSVEVLNDSIKMVISQMEQIKIIKNYNPIMYLPQLLTILPSSHRMAHNINEIWYSMELFIKYEYYQNYLLLFQYYQYICFITGIYFLLLIYSILILLYIVNLHHIYIFCIVIGYCINGLLQCYVIQSYRLYQMDYLLIGLLQVPVLLLYQLVIKLQDYGLLSEEKWIFRKHNFYSDYYDYWYYWIFYGNQAFYFPKDMYQITGIRQLCRFENNKWYNYMTEIFIYLNISAISFMGQIDCLLCEVINKINCFINMVLSFYLFVYGYLIDFYNYGVYIDALLSKRYLFIKYTIWFGIFGIMIFYVSVDEWIYLGLLVFGVINGMVFGRLIWFLNAIGGYFVLYHFYCVMGSLFLLGIIIGGLYDGMVIIVWVVIVGIIVTGSIYLSKDPIWLFNETKKYGKQIFPIVKQQSNSLGSKPYFNW